jgi:hypothetical protein
MSALPAFQRLFVFPNSNSERRIMSATTDPEPKKIKAVVALNRLGDGNITPLLDAALTGLQGHPDLFPKPPVDLATYEAAMNAYKAAIPAALDGSRTANAQKKKLRRQVIQYYELNGKYVEQNCDHDIAIFLLSGYQAASTAKTPPAPLEIPTMTVVQGPASGQLKATIDPLPKALSFKIRHAVAPPADGQPDWQEKTITTKKPVMYTDLTPGTVHLFQVCALGRLGFTDWSDVVSRMVI